MQHTLLHCLYSLTALHFVSVHQHQTNQSRCWQVQIYKFATTHQHMLLEAVIWTDTAATQPTTPLGPSPPVKLPVRAHITIPVHLHQFPR